MPNPALSQNYETLKFTLIEPHIVIVELHRPEAANAFNTSMATEIVSFFEAFSLNYGDCRAIILTGSGQKAFCAGGDLKERNGMTDAQWQAQHLIYERMVRAIMGCPIPIIAAVNGAAYGGGCELAAMADFVFAARHAHFAQTEVKLGIIPGAGGTQNLARAIGERRAKEVILSGRVFSAEEAYEWGLVNALFEGEALLDKTIAIAQQIAANGPLAVRQAKQAITRGMQMSIADGLAFEIEAYNRTIPTKDRQEGVAAFNERRAPHFTGS